MVSNLILSRCFHYAAPVMVGNLILSRCFHYHEIDNLVSLFYVPGTNDAFNWHYYMNFHHMLHRCDIYMLSSFKKETTVNKCCVSINNLN